ncbi:MAG: hypothetical protein ACRYGM_18675 [Janthinobacterium lividum]
MVGTGADHRGNGPRRGGLERRAMAKGQQKSNREVKKPKANKKAAAATAPSMVLPERSEPAKSAKK